MDPASSEPGLPFGGSRSLDPGGKVTNELDRKAQYPSVLADCEHQRIRARRRVAGRLDESPIDPDNGLPRDTVGLALSGGGIRSATFCLGVLRALARHRLIRRVDFLSTVSGGGFVGSFLGGLFTPRRVGAPPTPKTPPHPTPAPPAPDPTVDSVEDDLENLRSDPVDWLRENGRYMSPNGAGDSLLAGAVFLRNWVALHVVLVTAVVTALACLTAFRAYAATLFSPPWWPSPSETRLWLSPYLLVPLAVFFLVVVPSGWAYWFTQSWRKTTFPPFLTALALAFGCWLAHPSVSAGRKRLVIALVLAESVLALACWLASLVVVRSTPGFTSASFERVVRNRLSRLCSIGLWSAAGALLFALVDSVGQTAYALAARAGFAGITAILGSILAALLAGFGLVQKATVALGLGGGGKRLRWTPQMVASVLAAVALGLYLCTLSALVHAIAWKGEVPVGDPARFVYKTPSDPALALRATGSTVVVVSERDTVPEAPSMPTARARDSSGLLYAIGIGLLLSTAFGHTLPFLNLSSHQSLYGARLTRAYLGASNPKRWAGGVSVTELIPGDQVDLASYEPDKRGGPLHLVNVTLNETVSGKSQIEQRDRKGLALGLGPSGVSVGTRHHALWVDGARGTRLTPVAPEKGQEAEYQVFPAATREFEVEELDLGSWVGVSGAAFSPGLGAKTSLGLSLLFSLANVRLGYWWNSGVNPADRGEAFDNRRGRLGRLLTAWLPVQAYLASEVLARFHGPARRRWYLSDGGHFENTAAYELIRRRLPFIVLCDCGEDALYSFEDLGNLVRKARTDFDAEIAFFRRDQLDLVHPEVRPYFGSPEDFLTSKENPRPRCHAMLAWVYYGDPERKKAPGSLLLVLKPSVTGDEPLDVLQYKGAHEAFPQESTADQFFDEAQWESYRRLGEHIAQHVFAPPREGNEGWCPNALVPPSYPA